MGYRRSMHFITRSFPGRSSRETRKTVLFVTHNCFEACFVADRIVVLSPRLGRIAAEINVGPPPAPRLRKPPPVRAKRNDHAINHGASEFAELTPTMFLIKPDRSFTLPNASPKSFNQFTDRFKGSSDFGHRKFGFNRQRITLYDIVIRDLLAAISKLI